MDTACYVASATLTPGATGSDYVLDASVLEIVEIYSSSSSVSYGMERLSVGELLQLRRNSGVAASSPTLYYALAGHNMLMFYPGPSTSDTFTIYYVPVPTALSASADDPSSSTFGGIPKEFHKAIEYRACFEAADVEDMQGAEKYLQLYELQVKKIRRTLRRKGGSLMPRARVGPRGPRSNIRNINHDNSIW